MNTNDKRMNASQTMAQSDGPKTTRIGNTNRKRGSYYGRVNNERLEKELFLKMLEDDEQEPIPYSILKTCTYEVKEITRNTYTFEAFKASIFRLYAMLDDFQVDIIAEDGEVLQTLEYVK